MLDSDLKNAKILLVDDQQANIEVLKDFIDEAFRYDSNCKFWVIEDNGYFLVSNRDHLMEIGEPPEESKG